MDIFTLGPVAGSLAVGLYEKYFLATLRPYYNTWDSVLVPEHIILEERHHMKSPELPQEKEKKILLYEYTL